MTGFRPLAAVRLELRPVDPLHRPVSTPGLLLSGVAEVEPGDDDPAFGRDSAGVIDYDVDTPEYVFGTGTRAHLLRWQEDRTDGSLWRLESQQQQGDPRVADVLRRFDRGAVGRLAGDPVSLLAAEVRRLRGLPPP